MMLKKIQQWIMSLFIRMFIMVVLVYLLAFFISNIYLVTIRKNWLFHDITGIEVVETIAMVFYSLALWECIRIFAKFEKLRNTNVMVFISLMVSSIAIYFYWYFFLGFMEGKVISYYQSENIWHQMMELAENLKIDAYADPNKKRKMPLPEVSPWGFYCQWFLNALIMLATPAWVSIRKLRKTGNISDKKTKKEV